MKITVTCPHCSTAHEVEVNPAQLLASMPSKARAVAARINGRMGGRKRKFTYKVKLVGGKWLWKVYSGKNVRVAHGVAANEWEGALLAQSAINELAAAPRN